MASRILNGLIIQRKTPTQEEIAPTHYSKIFSVGTNRMHQELNCILFFGLNNLIIIN